MVVHNVCILSPLKDGYILSLVSTPSPFTGLEDTLRHKINVQIEDFRAAVQHTLGEQFNQYRLPAQNNTQSNNLPETNTHQVGES